MKNKIIFCILAFSLVFCAFTPAAMPVSAQSAQNGGTVEINGKSDYIEFAKKCTLDSYSQNLTVNLNCDIDFSGGGFVPIPTFGGTFNGNGHTISGINYTEKGSYTGVFRYVRQGGKISDLSVYGTIAPSGSKSFIGGIAGENSGTIENCSFTGSVKGENAAGGIAGENTENGFISSCVSYGYVSAENFAGGIAGKNSGTIADCTNNASVNTVYEEKKNDISDIDADTGAILESYKTAEEENEEETVLGSSDTGGIAGYSSGILRGCVNNANIGYKHVGYNTGGIAGRQSGYVLGCRNYGFIQGRKDVGGIVGQAEPYVLLNVSKDVLADLRDELDGLNTMINSFIDDTDGLGDDAKAYLDGLSDSAETARDSAEALINGGTDFIDGNIDEINAEAELISDTLDKFIPVFESLQSCCANLSSAAAEIAMALYDADISAPDFGDEINEIASAVSYISESEDEINRSVQKLKTAKNNLENAVKFSDKAEVKKAFSDISDAVKEIAATKTEIKKSAERIAEILEEMPGDTENLGFNAKLLAKQLKKIAEYAGAEISAVGDIGDGINTIVSDTEIDFSLFKAAVRNLEKSLDSLNDAVHYIMTGLSDLSDGIVDFSDSFEDYTDDLSDEISALKDGIADGTSYLSFASSDIEDALEKIGEILEDLSAEDDFEFVKLGDDFKSSSDSLFDSLEQMSDEISGLKTTISDGTDKIFDDLTAISDRFSVAVNLLIDEFDELRSTPSVDEIFLDVSDEEIESAKRGKIKECINYGEVCADRNTGGIAGAMAIEYSIDPEDEIEKPSALNFTYRSRAILQSCINEGKITGKKDCAGGIAGKAELGTIYTCENYGDTESTGGSYVGGIAGKSDSAIRKSYAKASLSGKRYVGGIAGKCGTIASCYAIVSVYGDENIGAVCGEAGDIADLANNYYTDGGTGAVDGISYSGKAEAMAFEEIKNLPGVPKKFIGFTVTFTDGEKQIASLAMEYGEKTENIVYPEIPPKDGCFGVWQKPEAETITENLVIECEYKPFITVLSSAEKNSAGKMPIALAEGSFTDSAVLYAAQSEKNPPENSGRNAKVYEISLLNADVPDGEQITLRLLCESKGTPSVFVQSGDKWESVPCTVNGKYAVFKVDSTESTVCIGSQKSHSELIFTISAAVCIAVLAVFLIKKLKKRKAKQRKS